MSEPTELYDAGSGPLNPVACPWCLSRGVACHHEVLPPRSLAVEVPADWYATLQAAQPELRRAMEYFEDRARSNRGWTPETMLQIAAAVRAALLPTPKE